MKTKQIKLCDRCLKEEQCKRMCLQIHFPYYNYVGFDLCSNCEEELNTLFNEFFNGVKLK